MMGGGKMKQVEAWDQMPTPESAFLGPQLWDRKICMKMNEMGWSVRHSGYQQRGYSDAAHSDSGHSTPSPTNFHQVMRVFELYLLLQGGRSSLCLAYLYLSVQKCSKVSKNESRIVSCLLLSSPGPKPLAPNPLVPNAKPRGLGLTLNCSRPPPPDHPPNHHPQTFKHDRGVPQQNSKSKNILDWSPLVK